MEKAKSIAATAVVIAVIALVLVWAITWQRQRTQFDRGEAAQRAGDHIAAIAGYEAAIHMYTPGSSTVDKAAARLWEVGEGLEQRGERDAALIAYRALRSSFHAVRGLSSPGTDWIAKCDRKIETLVRVQAPVAPGK